MFIKYILFIISLFTVISCNNSNDDKKNSKGKPPVIVDIIIAKSEDFPKVIEVNGSVLSEEMVELRPEISGRLTYLNFPDGGNVTEGTLIAKINDVELQAQLEQQKVQLDIANKTEQRLKKLLAINGVNQSDYDNALGLVSSIQANIKVLNAQIDKSTIKAPFSGFLGLRMVSVGAYVTPQTLIGTLQQTDKIKIDFTVPESYLYLLKVGNEITIQTNSSDKKEIAIISAIEPQISTTTRNIKVRAKLNNTVNINPGTFAKVLLYENNKGILIPTNAIIPEAQSNQVVIVKNNKAKFINVETGIRTADMVEIVKGLNEGDSVIISGLLFVRPDGKLKIKRVKSEK